MRRPAGNERHDSGRRGPEQSPEKLKQTVLKIGQVRLMQISAAEVAQKGLEGAKAADCQTTLDANPQGTPKLRHPQHSRLVELPDQIEPSVCQLAAHDLEQARVSGPAGLQVLFKVW